MNLNEIVKLWEVVQVFHRYTAFQKAAIIIGFPLALYVLYLITLGRPPLVVHDLRFVLLQDRQVRSLREGGDGFEIEFRLLNSTSPPGELHNIFGHVWIDAPHFLTATIPATRGVGGNGHVEWDIQIPVFPKEGVFLPAKIAAKMPQTNDEVLVGAQFVSQETPRVEYLWRIVNDNGVPKTVSVKHPNESK